MSQDIFPKPPLLSDTWSTIFEDSGRPGNAQIAATLVFLQESSTMGAPATALNAPFHLRVIPIKASDYAIAGQTTSLRIVGLIGANATAPGINFTFHLYPATIAGAANQLTMGTGTSAGNVAINTPAASTITRGDSANITFPADGAYIPAVVTSGTLATNSAVSIHYFLQVKNS